MEQSQQPQPMSAVANPDGKSFVVTWLLSYFLGVLGVDRFYLGKIGTGLLKLITIGGIGIWWLIDLIFVLTGNMKDKAGRPLEGYEKNKKVAWIVTAALVVLSAITNIYTPKPDFSTFESTSAIIKDVA